MEFKKTYMFEIMSTLLRGHSDRIELKEMNYTADGLHLAVEDKIDGQKYNIEMEVKL